MNTGSGFVNVANGAVPNVAGATYSGATTNSLTVTGTTTAMSSYQYRLQISNATCTTPVNSTTVNLTVRQLPTVTLTAAPLTTLLPGQITTLTATPSSSTGGTLTYQWLLNGTAIANTGNTRVVTVEQLGTYKVTIQETFAGGLTCANQSGDVVIGTTASDKLFLYPNPNSGQFTVSYYNNGGNSSSRRIVIFDSKGSKVYEKVFNITGPYTLLNIDLRGKGAGIYQVAVGDANGSKLKTGKVFVRNK